MDVGFRIHHSSFPIHHSASPGSPFPSPAIRIRYSAVLVYLSALHDEPHVLEHTNVLEWVARYSHQVRQQSRGDVSAITYTEQIHRVQCCSADSIRGSHPSFHEHCKLPRVVAMRVYRSVCAEGDLHSRFDRQLQTLTCPRQNEFGLGPDRRR